jgi:hypothetical protein
VTDETAEASYRAAQAALARQLTGAQSLPLATLGGLGAALGTGAVWGLLAVPRPWLAALASPLAGALIGLAIRLAGRGLDGRYAALAGAYAAAAIVIGEWLAIAIRDWYTASPPVAWSPGLLASAATRLGDGVDGAVLLSLLLAAATAASTARRRLAKAERQALFARELRRG